MNNTCANAATAEILKIGARGSPLSLAQTGLVANALEKANPGLKTEIVPIKTTGDKLQTASLAKIGGKGLFVKEIEEALLDGSIDLAVHSAKDLPTELPDGLVIGAITERADCRDALICRAPGGLEALPPKARVGTSGLRRQGQLLSIRPDLQIAPIRGNVATRLKKLQDEFDATLLAAAGLNRLGLKPEHLTLLPTETMLPAVGQGILALEVREDDSAVLKNIFPVNHAPTTLALAAERGFLSQLGGGCQLPVAALARLTGQSMTLEALIASPDGRKVVRGRNTAELDSQAAAANFGRTMAVELLEKGGREIMKEVNLL